MIKLLPSQFNSVASIRDQSYLSVQLDSVINGTNPGHIYVDSVDNPQTAIVFHQGEGGYYFIGNPRTSSFLDQLPDFFRETLKPELERLDLEDIEFSGETRDWDESFREVLSDFEPEESTQRLYLSAAKTLVNPTPLPDGYELIRIEPDLVDRKDLENIPFLLDTVLEWWPDWETFCRKSGGYIAMESGRIIARCIMDGSINSMTAIGIATEEYHRKKGIARSLASYLIADILNSDKTVYWECMGTNMPSRALAESCGLELHSTYQLFEISLSRL